MEKHYFTFAEGQVWYPGYVLIHAPDRHIAQAMMCVCYGNEWSMCLPELPLQALADWPKHKEVVFHPEVLDKMRANLSDMQKELVWRANTLMQLVALMGDLIHSDHPLH